MRKVTVTGVTGGSGSGKSTLVRAVVELLGPRQTSVLHQDHYYRDLSHLAPAVRAATNFDHPDALDLDLLADHVNGLRSGRAIERPVYDMATHTRRPGSVRVEPRELILVEGTMIGTDAILRGKLDHLVFVDLPEPERLARRIRRDVRERGRSEASVRRQWALTVAPMYARFIEPVRTRADLVVRGDAPPPDLAAAVAELLH